MILPAPLGGGRLGQRRDLEINEARGLPSSIAWCAPWAWACSMYERAHHRRIATLLGALDAKKLVAWECFFGGGTAVTLALGECRESVEVDFLCASAEGYRQLRGAVFGGRLDGLTRAPLAQLRDLRSDQYGVRTFVEIDGRSANSPGARPRGAH